MRSQLKSNSAGVAGKTSAKPHARRSIGCKDASNRSLVPASDDPVFAAIERWRLIAKACDRKSGDLPDKLADREGAALRAVAKCVPTSLLGILALLDFALGERKVPYSKKPVPLMERGLYDGDLLETIRRACHLLVCEECAELNGSVRVREDILGDR